MMLKSNCLSYLKMSSFWANWEYFPRSSPQILSFIFAYWQGLGGVLHTLFLTLFVPPRYFVFGVPSSTWGPGLRFFCQYSALRWLFSLLNIYSSHALRGGRGIKHILSNSERHHPGTFNWEFTQTSQHLLNCVHRKIFDVVWLGSCTS